MNSLTKKKNSPQSSEKPTLYYVHDPMCSWCWGFRKCWAKVQLALEHKVNIVNVVGGLAPDSNIAMPIEMEDAIKQHWRTIQNTVPGTEFNFDFWDKNQARRSTYPACRSVLTVKEIDASKEQEMIAAIQKAYYLNAQNPSDLNTLTDIASEIGISKQLFSEKIQSKSIEYALLEDIQFSRSIGVNSFPSLVLKVNNSLHEIKIDYNDFQRIIEQVELKILEQV